MGIGHIKHKTVFICLALLALRMIPLPAVLADKPSVTPGYNQTVGALETAYIVCDSHYLVVGKPARWKVQLSGDEGYYTYRFALFYIRDATTDGGYYTGVKEKAYSGDNAFDYTAENAGFYFVRSYVKDFYGNTLELQSEPVFSVSSKEANAKDSVIGIVKAAAAQCREETDGTDYGKALWLHDWLINRADYDESFTEYLPDGVLLKGTGTCQSYALAYQLLLSEAGVENIIVSGIADGDLHMWNLIKLDGAWYHVDVTWDDQGGTTPEYMYFGLPDTLMRRDHSWEGGNRYPACDVQEYDILERNGYLVFADADSLKYCLYAALAEKKESFRLYYAGTDSGFDLAEQLKTELGEIINGYRVSEYRWEASVWEGAAQLVYYSK